MEEGMKRQEKGKVREIRPVPTPDSRAEMAAAASQCVDQGPVREDWSFVTRSSLLGYLKRLIHRTPVTAMPKPYWSAEI